MHNKGRVSNLDAHRLVLALSYSSVFLCGERGSPRHVTTEQASICLPACLAHPQPTARRTFRGARAGEVFAFAKSSKRQLKTKTDSVMELAVFDTRGQFRSFFLGGDIFLSHLFCFFFFFGLAT
jgi:hypothetical protein